MFFVCIVYCFPCLLSMISFHHLFIDFGTWECINLRVFILTYWLSLTSMATKYDPDNEHEKHVSLPSAPSGHVAGTINVVFQPPLTRRGTGPGLLIVLPPSHAFSESTKKTLDPPPIQKLAEEGFFVVAITYDSGTFNEDVRTGLRFLSQQDSLENRVRMAIIGQSTLCVSSAI